MFVTRNAWSTEDFSDVDNINCINRLHSNIEAS